MIRVAINGFGRIGRLTFKNLLLNPAIDVVAINDLADNEMLSHLLKYDSAQGKFDGEVTLGDDTMIVNGKTIKMYAIRNPEELPWTSLDIDVVVESTGIFRTKEGAEKHLTAGAKRVVISAPAKDKSIPTFVLGVNGHRLNSEDAIVSNASCTTNCLAPMVKVLHEKFGIEKGFMTTIHAYTADQRIVDAPHRDYRRARAAAVNIIPTTTGAAKTVELVYPEIKGKLHGMAARVPVPTGSLTDFTVELSTDVTAAEVNKVFEEAANNELSGILEYTTDPIVSSDIVGNRHSCIFDSSLTHVDGSLVKIIGWYDNEAGYAARTADLVAMLK